MITGAAGFVGRILRSHWGPRYQLRLLDVRNTEAIAEYEAFVEADIAEYDQMLNACRGVDTVVHLAADPSPSATFYDTLLSRNVIGAYNAIHAAYEAQCRRIVFASSMNAVLGHLGGEPVQADGPPYPQNVYGATKVWGEALARVYSDRYDLSCICVRLASPRFAQNGDWNPEEVSNGISPRDMAQLFGRCVDVENLSFAIVNGVSRHRRSHVAIEATCQLLGYEPRDGTAFPKTA